jgi:hypothetical protein
MKLNDKNIVDTLERKNDLESFIYKWREQILGDYKDFVQ